MAMRGFMETRSLKRPRLGPPDVYPQNPKQKEDELNPINVKHGFKCVSPCNEEHSSAHLYSVDPRKISRSFTALLTHKQIVNTFNDSGKKRPQLSKDNFSLVPVINASKFRNHSAWFKELASHKPLLQLCKNKVPVFNKKEDIFQSLADFEVPVVRATWFIKMTAAYHLTQTDAKMKKRVANDPNSDWTQAICKFMREQMLKLNEGSQSGNLSNQINTSVGCIGLGLIYHMGSTTATILRDDFEKQLTYISNLAHHMFTEGLLDRQELLSWFVDEFESIPLYDSIALSYFMPYILQYVEDVAVNHLFARRMCFAAARHLNWILPSPNSTSQFEKDSVQLALDKSHGELLPIVHTLSSAIQTTVLLCPGALVWYSPTDSKSCGSPLDLIPMPPSKLPLPDIPKEDIKSLEEDQLARNILREKEKEISLRSNAVELHWSSSTSQDATTGYTINKVLCSLEALDKQNFEKSASLDSLYHKIFDQGYGNPTDSQMLKRGEDAVIELLCEWAITTNRLGEHRAAVVAKLLDQRQMFYEQRSASTHHSEVVENSSNYQPPYFQNLLFNFLDERAPELKNPENLEELQAFRNLVLLFSELMEHDVFSHDLYINNLISRGDIAPGQLGSFYSVTTPLNKDQQFSSESRKLDYQEDKLEYNNSTESVFSPENRHDRHFLDAVRTVDQPKSGILNTNASLSHNSSTWGYGQNKHVQYIMHFPISHQDESNSYEWNQRLMVLYGSGRHKTQVKRSVRKILRHLVKLIQNKTYIKDESEFRETGRTRVISQASHDELLMRYRNLSYFDQHLVTSHAAKTLLSSLDNVICRRSSQPPQLLVVGLLLDLMEEALNISELMRLAVSICNCLLPLLKALESCNTNFLSDVSLKKKRLWYSTELSLIVVAILRHYQSYLLLNHDLTLAAFDGLFNFAKHSCLSNPATSTSPDRSILVLLNDLYSAPTSYVKASRTEFGNYAGVVRQVLYSTKMPATTNCRYESSFLKQYIDNPEMESSLTIAEQFYNTLHDKVHRYSFVCSAIITLCCGPKNFEKVNALAALCAEMSSRCSELSAEWLGVLKALCSSSSSATYNDVLMHVDASDPQIRDPLALFTAVLIARSCLSLEGVIEHVAIPSLLAACEESPAFHMTTTDPSTSARLTCHLLLQLFKAPSNFPNSKQSFHLPSSSDRHLLAAAQKNIADGAVLAVLKAVLKLGDAGSPGRKGMFSDDGDVSVTSFLAPIQDFDDVHDGLPNPAESMGNEETSWMEQSTLMDFAKHAVRVICSQQWVRDRCLKYPNMDLLVDKVLTKEQTRTMIQLICYADSDLKRLSTLSTDPQKYVVNMLTDMSKWTLRQCLLELQVMLCGSSQQKNLPEYIARATIDVFQNQQMRNLESHEKQDNSKAEQGSVWLIAPLIRELPSQVQARVLQQASTILEAPPNWSSAVTHTGTERISGSSLLNHQPFLALIITCLQGQYEERNSLVESLQSQIIMMHSEWQNVRSQRDAGKDTPYSNTSQNGRNEALQLRLSLVGGMFDTVQSNTQWTSDIVVLLTQLIHSGMVDIQVNNSLYYTVYDMIAVLLHHTLGGDAPARQEGSKREYLNIVKKMKKEIGEYHTKSVSQLRQLLPIPRPEFYVVCCEPIGPLLDVKGNKLPVSADGSSGLQAVSKQKLNQWEVIEGLKNPAPLCLAWFGARKTERKLLKYEEEHLHLLHHEHGDKRYLEEYLKPQQFPPEEDDTPPPPAKVQERKSLAKGVVGTPSPSPVGDQKKLTPKSVRTKRNSRNRSRVSDAGSNSYRPSPQHNMGVINRPPMHGIGMVAPNPNFPLHQTNPSAYQPYQGMGTSYTQPPGYQQPKNKGMPESKQLLEMHIRNRIRSNNNVAAGFPIEGPRSNPIRHKLTAKIKTTPHAPPDYLKQPIRAPQQPHVIPTNNMNYVNYNVVPKQTNMRGYNNGGGLYRATPPLPYQQSTVMQGNQTYMTSQQSARAGNYGNPQQGSYQQPGLGPMHGQAQYGVNVQPTQMSRLNSQQIPGGIHSLNNPQNIQAGPMMDQVGSMMDQRQMVEQPMINPPL